MTTKYTPDSEKTAEQLIEAIAVLDRMLDSRYGAFSGAVERIYYLKQLLAARQ